MERGCIFFYINDSSARADGERRGLDRNRRAAAETLRFSRPITSSIRLSFLMRMQDDPFFFKKNRTVPSFNAYSSCWISDLVSMGSCFVATLHLLLHSMCSLYSVHSVRPHGAATNLSRLEPDPPIPINSIPTKCQHDF